MLKRLFKRLRRCIVWVSDKKYEQYTEQYSKEFIDTLDTVQDNRDFTTPDTTDASKPVAYDIRTVYKASILDQGVIGSCVANALVTCNEILHGIHKKAYQRGSRLFIYFNARLPIVWSSEDQEFHPGIPNEENRSKLVDKGTHGRDALRVMQKLGVPRETTWVYNRDKVNAIPDDKSYAEAKNYRIRKYYNIPTGSEVTISIMESILATNIPLYFSMRVYSKFNNSQITNKPLEQQTYQGSLIEDKLVGGHAMCIVGYNSEKKYFIVQNSWGDWFGDKGYLRLDYNVFLKDVKMVYYFKDTDDMALDPNEVYKTQAEIIAEREAEKKRNEEEVKRKEQEAQKAKKKKKLLIGIIAGVVVAIAIGIVVYLYNN